MNTPEVARSTFLQGFNCAQSVISTFGPRLGLEPETALRLASAFGGGIAGTGETCGAVTGALMVIGLKHGMGQMKDTAAKERTKDLSRRLMGEFTLLYGSVKCREILGCDVSEPGGLEQARSRGLLQSLCPGFVEGAVKILEEIL